MKINIDSVWFLPYPHVGKYKKEDVMRLKVRISIWGKDILDAEILLEPP